MTRRASAETKRLAWIPSFGADEPYFHSLYFTYQGPSSEPPKANLLF